MAKKTEKISTFEELQQRIPELLDKHGDNQELLRAAMANPVLALKEVGIELSPEVERELKLRARFGKKDYKKMRKLEHQIFEEAGTLFDLQSEEETLEVCKTALKERELDAKDLEEAIKNNLYPVLFEEEKGKAPFSNLAKDHKLLQLLDDYYELERTRPRLADRDMYERVKQQKDLPFSLSDISFEMQGDSQE